MSADPAGRRTDDPGPNPREEIVSLERLPARLREKLERTASGPGAASSGSKQGLLLTMLLILIAASGAFVLWRAMEVRQGALEGAATAGSSAPTPARTDSIEGRTP